MRMETELGTIEISSDAIATIAGIAAVDAALWAWLRASN